MVSTRGKAQREARRQSSAELQRGKSVAAPADGMVAATTNPVARTSAAKFRPLSNRINKLSKRLKKSKCPPTKNSPPTHQKPPTDMVVERHQASTADMAVGCHPPPLPTQQLQPTSYSSNSRGHNCSHQVPSADMAVGCHPPPLPTHQSQSTSYPLDSQGYSGNHQATSNDMVGGRHQHPLPTHSLQPTSHPLDIQGYSCNQQLTSSNMVDRRHPQSLPTQQLQPTGNPSDIQGYSYNHGMTSSMVDHRQQQSLPTEQLQPTSNPSDIQGYSCNHQQFSNFASENGVLSYNHQTSSTNTVENSQPPALSNVSRDIRGPNCSCQASPGDPSGCQNFQHPSRPIYAQPSSQSAIVEEEGKVISECNPQVMTGLRPLRYSGGLSVGAGLSSTLKQKIWDQKYVEFAELLFKDNSKLSLAIQDDDNPSLRFMRNPRRPLTEKHWAAAFDEFVAIHCLKFPSDLIPLLSYGKYIKLLMSTGYNWAIYDREFRRMREETLCAWDHIHLDLQLMATKHQTKPDSHSFSGYRARKYNNNAVQSNKSRVCFAFNSPVQRCTRPHCPYEHVCKSCSNSHPVFMCRKKHGNSLPKLPTSNPSQPQKA